MEIAAVIFDMDGLLIDSEPLWREAERAAFAEVGVLLSDEDCELTMGCRNDEVVAYWFDRVGWSGTRPEEVGADMVRRVRDLIVERGTALPGVYETVDSLKEAGLGLALASSSAMELIQAVIAKLGLADAFDVVCSAMDEVRGKPDPAVFLTAARRLGVEPRACLVFEDSIAGVAAALAAGMMVVAVPAANLAGDQAFDRVHLKLRSLAEFRVEMVTSELPDNAGRR